MTETKLVEHIQVWRVEDLVPYDKNPRTHTILQVDRIMDSIREFGFVNPILVDESAGVIAGHGRLQAAKRLGLERVPVVVLDHLNESQRQAYVIADNKLASLAGWDDELLQQSLEELEGSGFDVTVLGWGDSLPTFVSMPDYSVLEDDEVEHQLDEMTAGVKRAIQIEFEPEDYETARDLVKFWRQKGAYVGEMIIAHLEAEKARE